MLQSALAKSKCQIFVGERADGVEQGRQEILWTSQRITDTVKAPAVANHRPWMKGFQIKGSIIQCFACFRVTGKKDLKSVVELESLQTVRPRAPADTI
ncbi:MAG: hypothetical protein Nkreftii_001992 [Candidatus Nitrospira kreftii]|uniref:Uncharacterized protein n=1 Tax=Candidatus Nitrospira kreftii TaxID=2652173 RepID=A0A7S8IZE9_9BACT|nr:MAG: hypothetical protein Nkreftii_001992 [Candidatus Nitrospira kreftii]